MQRNTSRLFYRDRERLVQAYDQMIKDRLRNHGMKAYFLNFMFKDIVGSYSYRMSVMGADVDHFHRVLERHIVRKPTSENWKSLRPILIGSPDLPVPKLTKNSSIADYKVNGGLHYNAVVLVPPRYRHELKQEGISQSRLKTGLVTHVRRDFWKYRTEYLASIFVQRITYGSMADYTLKAFKNGKMTNDELKILC